MKNYLIIFILGLLTLSNLFGAKITDDVLKVGIPGSAADKTLYLGDNRLIRSNETTGAMEFTNDAGSLWKKIGSGSGAGGSGGVNVLLNSGAEDGLVNWTNSGGTFTQQSYTEAVEGDAKFFRFIATAAAQYVETDLITLPDNISGGCMADIKYIQGDNVFILKVIDQVPADISTDTLSDLTEWLKAPTQAFNCPTQGKLRIESTAAGTIDFDAAYLGSNKNISPVGKSAHFVGSILWPENSPCVWARSSATYGGYADDLDCDDIPRVIVGDITDSALGLQPKFSMNLAKGHYEVVVSGAIGSNALVNAANSYRLSIDSDTIISNSVTSFESASTGDQYQRVPTAVFSFDISTPISSAEIAIHSKNTAAASHGVNPESSDFKFSVYYYPSSNETQEAFTPPQADFFISGEIGGANVAVTATATTQFFNHASLDMVMKNGVARIPCVGNNPTGLTCSVGNEQFGVVFNAPRTGKYKLCMSGTRDGNQHTLRLVKTTAINSDIIDVIGVNMANSSSSNTINFRLCDVFDINSIGDHKFLLGIEGNVATTINADRNASFFDRNLGFSVELVSHKVSRPIIQNMIDTSVGSGSRLNSCKVNLVGGTPSSLSSSCDSWIDSYTDVGLGLVTINLTNGVYSLEPQCEIQIIERSDTAILTAMLPTTSISAISVRIKNTTGLADYNFNITCTGAR